MDADTPKTWHEAFTAAHQAPSPLGEEEAPLRDARGCTLGAPLRALTALPGFNTAAMDGYATAGEGPWRLVDTVGARAGSAWTGTMRMGEAIPIATGALLPAGADRVLPVESAQVAEEWVTARGLPLRNHIRTAGEDTALGEVVAEAGATVTAALLGLAAAVGYDRVPVRRRARVSLVVTGDELVDAGVPEPPQIRDALAPMIGPLVEDWGGRLGSMTHVGDHEPLPLTQDVDVVIVTGSTSVGTTDRLRHELSSTQRVVDGVACRPGHPMLLAQIPQGPWVVGLPGNPYAAFIAAHTLVWPLLLGLAGAPLPSLRSITMPPTSGGTQVLPVRKDGKLWAVCPGYGSASLRGAALAEGLAVVDADGSALLLRF